MRLYGFWRSSATWRVRIALHLKNVECAYQAVDLSAGEHLNEPFVSVNELRQVPVLEVETDSGSKRLTQSVAIMEYLDERYPDPPLLPSNAMARAQTRQIVEMINAGIQPLQNSGVQRYVSEVLKADGRAWLQHWVKLGMAALERTVSGTAGDFCVGDRVSLADACLVPEMFFCRRFEIPLDLYPTLSRIDAHCAELAAFRAAHGRTQPDAPVDDDPESRPG